MGVDFWQWEKNDLITPLSVLSIQIRGNEWRLAKKVTR